MKKGSSIFVKGEIEYRSYVDKEGQTKYSTEIRVNSVGLLSKKDEGAVSSAPRAAAAAPAPRAVAGAPVKALVAAGGEFPEEHDESDGSVLPF